jgi:hypothetical protein
MTLGRGLVVLGALVTLPVACGLFLGLEPPEGKPLPPPAEAGADPCQHHGPPEPPAKEDPSNGDIPPFWLAIRRSYLGATAQTPDAGPPGFDLDGVCTCESSPNTAHDGGESCVPRAKSKPHCDSEKGVDNEFENILKSYAGVFDLNGFTSRVDDGSLALLVYVADYNGQANDLSVTLGFAVADGLFSTDCDPALRINDLPPGSPNGNQLFRASWRGCDKWHALEDQMLGNPNEPGHWTPRALGKGYVRDNVLVLKGNVDVPIFFNESEAKVQDPIFVAPLKPVDSTNPSARKRFRMDGAQLAGRLPLRNLAEIAWTANYNSFFVCENPGVFASMMEGFCGGIDSAESASLDFQGKPCQSMSFGLRLDADAVDLDPRPWVLQKGQSSGRCTTDNLPPLDSICPLAP